MLPCLFKTTRFNFHRKVLSGIFNIHKNHKSIKQCTVILSLPMHTRYDGNSNGKSRKYLFSVQMVLASVLLSTGLLLRNRNDNLTSKCESVVDIDESTGTAIETSQNISNWSNTHSCHPNLVYEPTSAQEVSRILRHFHEKKEKLRPIGTALSPNGIGLNGQHSLLSLSSIDYIEVDAKKKLVTVGAGARVSSILSELKKHGLTLENFSSIQEQQIGGWTQVSAHGTGSTLSTVDDMIVSMQLVTPDSGILTLSDSELNLEADRRLFHMAKVGLGSLGVVTEVTLRCIPQLMLREETCSTVSADIGKTHYSNLAAFRHLRYMWIPFTDKVVVVKSNPATTFFGSKASSSTNEVVAKNATKGLTDYLSQLQPQLDATYLQSLSISQLRDMLLDLSPLDVNHVKKVNRLESEYWSKASGVRVDDSTNVLGFDCGGEQLVFEVCIPIGSMKDRSNRDLMFVQELLEIIEEKGIPAASPIEQRWTARSESLMSPAYSKNKDDIFSWVGIIMYLPPGQSDDQRKQIQKKFNEYCESIRPLMNKYNAKTHWAKIELPERDKDYDKKVNIIRDSISSNYPKKDFNDYRKLLDPNNILSNNLIDELFKE